MQLRGRKSLTFRLTLLFATASTVVLLALGYVIEGAVNRHFIEQDMELLDGKLELARNALQHTRSPTDLADLPQRLDDSLVGHHGLAVAVIAGNGKTLFSTHGMQFPAALTQANTVRDALPYVWNDSQGSFRGIAGSASMGIAGEPPARVIAAVEISHHLMFLDAFRITLWLFVSCAALLMGILGWVATRRALAPLHEMRRGAAAVTASHLDYRLPVDSVPIELATLAATLNDMLARLEDSFRRLSDFSSDLAHELRTPISNLMTQTQVALTRSRSADEYRELLYSNAEEFERLARMISDMLFLAKADNGLIAPRHEMVKLDREVAELFDFYEALAEERGVRLELSGEAQVTGDRLMLRRAISNLLSNALRYTERGGCIDVSLKEIESGKGNAVQLSITNPGEPIAAEHLPRLFDRFYRADPSRHRASDGVGLGLAITRSILRAHDGDISVSSSQGKTRFDLTIPVDADCDPDHDPRTTE